jgi:hypothetical protein
MVQSNFLTAVHSEAEQRFSVIPDRWTRLCLAVALFLVCPPLLSHAQVVSYADFNPHQGSAQFSVWDEALFPSPASPSGDWPLLVGTGFTDEWDGNGFNRIPPDDFEAPLSFHDDLRADEGVATASQIDLRNNDGNQRPYRPFQSRIAADAPQNGAEPKKWYETISIRGYGQFRYNQLGATNPRLRSPLGDRSVGGNNGFFLRRARLVFSGDVHDRVYVYTQPDFATEVIDGAQHFLQVRDWYADLFLDDQKEYRFRVGQSKVPYGFENLQSSQNRIPLDRADGLNSGAPNERDVGVFFYWAPDEIRQRFRHLVQSGLKGTGDYGVFGLGVYNGQTANRPELNDNRHIVARWTYPFQLDNGQIFEPGISGYTGRFAVQRSPGVAGGTNFRDQRIAWSFVWYPQPLGFQAEYTIGEGPEFNRDRLAVERSSLHGGAVQLYYRYITPCHGVVVPFTRFHYYRGGLKQTLNAIPQRVNEAEIGVEWEPIRELELTAMYTFADRTSPVFPYRQESGSLLRLQLQWNY